jgi:hypothetical protein
MSDFYAQDVWHIRIEDQLLQKLGVSVLAPSRCPIHKRGTGHMYRQLTPTERKSTESELASWRRLRARLTDEYKAERQALKDEHLRHRWTK